MNQRTNCHKAIINSQNFIVAFPLRSQIPIAALPLRIKLSGLFSKKFVKLSCHLGQWFALISIDSLLHGIIIAEAYLCHILKREDGRKLEAG
jgi:hypothetical protein